MTYQLLFWFLVIVSVLFGLWTRYNSPTPPNNRATIGSLLIFVLIILLGLGIYGPALHR